MARRTEKPVNAEASDALVADATPEARALAADIEQSREEMSRTVQAIEERLSPAHFKEQVADLKDAVLGEYREAKEHIKEDLRHELKDAKQALSGEIGDVKQRIESGIEHAKTAAYDATVGKVSDMMDEARETVSEAGDSLLDTIRANPIPVALIAVGVGWLFLGSRSPDAGSSRMIRRGTRALGRAAHTVGDTAQDLGHRARDGADDLVHRVQDGAGRVAHRVQDGASELGHRVADRAEHIVDDVRDAGRHAADDVRLAARKVGREVVRAEHRLESMYDSTPLAFGAVAAVVGAAVGLGLPSTAREDAWLGEAKDRLLDQAHHAAQDALHGAEEKIDRVADLAATAQRSMHRMTEGIGEGSAQEGTTSSPRA